jgi:hypothetical protein
MIDMFTTLLSTLGAIFVCYRAIKLDRQLPWFENQRASEGKAKLPASPSAGGPSRGRYDLVERGPRPQPRPAR